jgi:hypothetical protein
VVSGRNDGLHHAGTDYLYRESKPNMDTTQRPHVLTVTNDGTTQKPFDVGEIGIYHDRKNLEE